MKFSFKEWLKRKPADPFSYYLKQSRLAIYVSVMFLCFFIGHNWVLSPNKIANTENWFLFPYLTVELMGEVISQGLDKIIFGVYSFVFDSIKYSFSVLGKIAFWGVVVFLFLSFIFGFVAGMLDKNKKILLVFTGLTIFTGICVSLIGIYAYFVAIISIPLVTTILLKKRKSVEASN